MRPKRQNVCQQCRSRKLGCDGKVPACGQCTLRQISCGGYPRNFVILSQLGSNSIESKNARKEADRLPPRSTKTSPKSGSVGELSTAPQGGLLSRSLQVQRKRSRLEDDVQFIVDHYMPLYSNEDAESNPWHNQMCGSWVEALPLFLAKGQVPRFLASAIRSFAVALSHHCLGSEKVEPQLLELYGESLELVADVLWKAGGVMQAEHCTAIMCMAVTELIFPTSQSSWAKHAAVIGDFFERQGPEEFTTGILHKLFVGFRPLLLNDAVLNRRNTFLAKPEWRELPFKGRPLSMAQTLLNEAVRLPNLLQRYNRIALSSHAADFAPWDQVRTDLEALLQSLQIWEATYRDQFPLPLYWKLTDNDNLSSVGDDTLWFRDLMTATSLTYCWAFKITVMKHLDFVRRTIETLDTSSSTPESEILDDIPIPEQCVVLAERICNSMSFFMRPEMKLWGPASTYIAFTTTVHTFKDNESTCRSQLLRCQDIFEGLVELKVQFPGIQELLW